MPEGINTPTEPSVCSRGTASPLKRRHQLGKVGVGGMTTQTLVAFRSILTFPNTPSSDLLFSYHALAHSFGSGSHLRNPRRATKSIICNLCHPFSCTGA